jgi:hypothetical protein
MACPPTANLRDPILRISPRLNTKHPAPATVAVARATQSNSEAASPKPYISGSIACWLKSMNTVR